MNALTSFNNRIASIPDGQLKGIEQFNREATQLDPAAISWPATLPIELALKTASPADLQAEYKYSDAEWAALRHNPIFLQDLTAACAMVKQEGMTFKMKARLQAEELLKTSWRLIHAPSDEVSPAVKADLIKSTARWAGYDAKEAAGAGGNVNALSIQINL